MKTMRVQVEKYDSQVMYCPQCGNLLSENPNVYLQFCKPCKLNFEFVVVMRIKAKPPKNAKNWVMSIGSDS